MAKLIINENISMNGRLSIKRSLIEQEENTYVIIEGILATHYYIEELKSIESTRYLIKDIKVIEENFGSDDHDIIYSFRIGSLKVKEGETIYTYEEIEEIEKDMYKEDGSVKE